eukprot:TRINITY_DN1647_c0_g1_i4.p1 TRINITY_DN1647_c0_g1~~TRINITY_DN1647_c0_g1_i4.p1  ORF type:complete len:444 (-),score=169.02 TRINITY_DN1647_c0_g1_i4:35-1366(-)
MLEQKLEEQQLQAKEEMQETEKRALSQLLSGQEDSRGNALETLEEERQALELELERLKHADKIRLEELQEAKDEAVQRLEKDLVAASLEINFLQGDLLAAKEEAAAEIERRNATSLKVQAELEGRWQEATLKLEEGLADAEQAKEEATLKLKEGLANAEQAKEEAARQLQSLSTVQAERDALGQQVAHASQQARQLEGDLQAARAEGIESRQEVDRLRKELLNAENAVQQIREAEVADARRIAAGETEVAKARIMDIGSQMKEQLRAAAARTSAAESKVGLLQNELSVAEEARAKVEGAQAGLLRELDCLRAAAASAEANLEAKISVALQEQAAKLQAALSEAKEASQLRERVASLEQWGQTVGVRLKDFQKTAQEAKAKEDSLLTELQAARADAARGRDAAKNALIELRESDKVVKALRDHLSMCQKEKSDLESQMSLLLRR